MSSENTLTLAEMKDGLTSFPKVEELVSVMKSKVASLKSDNETARQWHTFASTILATSDRDNLNHFIHLGGLLFLDWWLQETHKICSDSSNTMDFCLDESITSILEALRKLSIEDTNLHSGIRVTVMNLFSHKSFSVRKKARDLFNSWIPDFVKDGVNITFKSNNQDAFPVTNENGCKANNQTVSMECSTEDNCGVKLDHSGFQHSRGSDCSPSESVNLENVPISIVRDDCIAALNHGDEKIKREISPGLVSKTCIASLSHGEKEIKRETSLDPVGKTLISSAVKVISNPSFAVDSNISVRSSIVPELKDSLKAEKDTDKSNDGPGKFDVKDLDSPLKEDKSANSDSAGISSESFSKAGGACGFATTDDLSERERDSKVSDTCNLRSDTDFDYGVDDALEVARQVAREVEREVVDNREQFCSSSSEKNSGCGVVQPGSPDSINANHARNEILTEQNISTKLSSQHIEEHLSSTDTMKTLDCTNDTDTSQVTEAIQEQPDHKTEKTYCDFDLNEDICSEEMPHQNTPFIAVHRSDPVFVSASKATAPGLPESPPCFQGERGWKGSAATSAFRPASPRKTSNEEKTIKFDLNVLGGEDVEATTQPLLANPIPISSDFPSEESSIEVSSRFAERTNYGFDLNHIGDKEDAPASDRVSKGHSFCIHQNGIPSPASSSTSKQLSSVRNIDLNDNPSMFDNSNDQRGFLSNHSSRDKNVGVITIMGKRVEVNQRTESVPKTGSPFLSAQESPVAGDILTRSSFDMGMHPIMTYMTPPHPAYGYNSDIAKSMSFSPAMYGCGPIPYMVDSRGTVMSPQIMCSPPGIRPSYPSEHFLMMSMNPHMAGHSGSSRTVPDLNSGMTFMESENRNPGGFRQSFIPSGQGMFLEEPPRSVVGIKRKETDGELELNPYRYKHHSTWN